MVNAVLRRIQSSEHRAQSSEEGTAVSLAAEWAHPKWMVERWVRRYGREAAEAICRWGQEPTGATLRVSEGPGELEGIETEPGYFLGCARRVVRGDVGRSAGVRDGGVWIQDEASQLVGEITAVAGAGAKRVMDMCAAPGGKTAILAERLPEAEITAVDVSRVRLDLMRKRRLAARARRIAFEAGDAAKMQLKPELDLILCDVPCSGTGTMARNPEIRLRVTEADLARQHAREAAILQAGLKGLKPGGRLVYSTCSLEPEENEEVVEEVLRALPGFSVVPVAGFLDDLGTSGVVTAEGRERLRTATEGDFLRMLPGVHRCDGFFAVLIQAD
jgi:16S rRNA (cytosine967-C5)-methyltransferase